VKLVAEFHRPEVRDLYRDLFGQMTGAALGKTKSTNLVMTLTARLALFHLSHRDYRVFLADFIESVVTEGTVVAELL
jgi:hypothetical protein